MLYELTLLFKIELETWNETSVYISDASKQSINRPGQY